MDSLVLQLRSLIGTPPAGLEFLEYLFLGFLLIFLVYSAVSVISAVFRWLGGDF